MKKILLLLIDFTIAVLSVAAPKTTPNVVIESKNEVYKFIPSKDGNSLARVEQTTQLTFRANRVADTGIALAYYSDDIKIDKVTGGTTTYGPYFGKDVFFSDSRACLIAVDLKKAGATGKASYRCTFTKPEFFCKVIIPELYNIETATVVFEIPESLQDRFRLIDKNLPAEKMTKTEERKGGKLVVTYTLKDIPEPEFYSDAPSINVTAPQILVVGHYRDVDDLYRYLRSYTLNEDPATETVAAKAREITADCTTDAERIAAVTDFVHNTVRYVAVENGEFGQRPDLPSEVLRKAYGDCKCSAILIKAMLNAVGIDGRLVWVGTNSIPEKWTDVPNVSSGNHMIAAAMTGDSILFIDGTAKYNPAGTLPLGVQGRQAIVEDTPEKCIIATIPATSPSANARAVDLTARISSSGDMEIDGSITMTGAYMHALQSMLSDTPPAKRAETHSKMFATVMHGSHAKDAALTEYADSAVISGLAALSGAVKRAGEEIYVDLNPDSGLADLKFSTDDRWVRGQISRVGADRAKITLLIPDDAEIADLPKPVAIDNRWVSGSIVTEPSADGRSVTRVYDFTIKDSDVPLADFGKFNADIHRLNRASTAKIVLKSK